MTVKEQKFSAVPTPQKVELIADQILEKKGQRLLALDLSKQQSLSEAVIIVTASSIRHGQGLADHVLQYCKAEKIEFLGMEGYNSGQWILLDLNDIIVHVFQTEARDLFRLDDLWPSAGVLLDHSKEA